MEIKMRRVNFEWRGDGLRGGSAVLNLSLARRTAPTS